MKGVSGLLTSTACSARSSSIVGTHGSSEQRSPSNQYPTHTQPTRNSPLNRSQSRRRSLTSSNTPYPQTHQTNNQTLENTSSPTSTSTYHNNAPLSNPPLLPANNHPTSLPRHRHHTPPLHHLLRPLSLRKHNLPPQLDERAANLRRRVALSDKLYTRTLAPTAGLCLETEFCRQDDHGDME